jgi:hypothetical protein
MEDPEWMNIFDDALAYILKYMVVLGLIVSIGSCTMLVFTASMAHGQTIPTAIDCPELTKLDIRGVKHIENDHMGRQWFFYDRDNDGQPDAAYGADLSDGRGYFRFYQYDIDFDGIPDVVYEDYSLDGTCRHLHKVWTPSSLAPRPKDMA